MIARQNYIVNILKYLDSPFIKILTGVRRSGKSTILQMIIQKLKSEYKIPDQNILNIRFDSMEYQNFSNSQMYNLIKEKISTTNKTYIFLDEVQEIDGWEKVVNSIFTDFDVDIYITGSNSKMLSSEIATYLTGRYVQFFIYTLSFKEFLEFKSTWSKLEPLNIELRNYVKFGGFPATNITDYSQDEIYTIVHDIYNSTIFSDIVRRNQIRKIDQLERIVKYTFQNVGNTFSAKSISDYIKSENRKIDIETVYNYLENLEKTYLIHRVSRFDIQGKEILKTQEKFYLADTALRFSVLGYSPDDFASSLENVVYLELRRRGYNVYIGKLGSNEIDFVAIKLNEKLYIQVTQEINSLETEKREYEKLLQIKDNYPKYVLRTDDYAEGKYEGIKTMHIADFLLCDEY